MPCERYRQQKCIAIAQHRSPSAGHYALHVYTASLTSTTHAGLQLSLQLQCPFLEHFSDHRTFRLRDSRTHLPSSMDPGPSEPSDTRGNQRVCVCRKYCDGQPRLLSKTTFYRHLAEAEQDEQNRLHSIKMKTLEAAHASLVHEHVRLPLGNGPQQAGPSRGISRSAQRVETQHALAKRARELPDSQRHVGKRKCTRVKENLPVVSTNLQVSRLQAGGTHPIYAKPETVFTGRETHSPHFSPPPNDSLLRTTLVGCLRHLLLAEISSKHLYLCMRTLLKIMCQVFILSIMLLDNLLPLSILIMSNNLLHQNDRQLLTTHSQNRLVHVASFTTEGDHLRLIWINSPRLQYSQSFDRVLTS